MKSGSRGFRPLQGRAPWFSAAARLQQLPLRLGRPAGGPRSRILNATYTEPWLREVSRGTDPDTDTLLSKGGARTGTDPTEMVAPPDGRLHGLDSVYVADASLFPISV